MNASNATGVLTSSTHNHRPSLDAGTVHAHS
jgi:hypothetical protein